MSLRVVVTGGGGFIGSRVVGRLVAEGHQPILIGADLGRSQSTARLVADGRVQFVRYDGTGPPDGLGRVFLGGERLLLLGYSFPTAVTHPGRLREELHANVAGATKILEAATGRFAHVVFASSAAVYGMPRSVPVPETELPRPRTAYGIAKLGLEHAVQLLADVSGATSTILRYGTVFGPGETAPRAIPNFIRRALAGAPLRIEGDGLDESDYVFIDDVVEVTVSAVLASATGTYNIGTGIGTTTLTIARLVLALTEAASDLEFIAARYPSAARSRVVLATDRAFSEFGFTAFPALRSGVEAEVAWFRRELDAELATRSLTYSEAATA